METLETQIDNRRITVTLRDTAGKIRRVWSRPTYAKRHPKAFQPLVKPCIQ